MSTIKNWLDLDQIYFDRTLEFKRKKRKSKLHYPAMLVMTSRILKSVSFTKTQKSRYLENKTLFFLQIKKFINYTSSAIL